MRPPLVPVPRLPEDCNLCGHNRRRSLSCFPRRYSTGRSNCYHLPRGICMPDERISSCLSCLPSEQFPVQPANLYAPWIGLPGGVVPVPLWAAPLLGACFPGFPVCVRCLCVAVSGKLRNETHSLRPHSRSGRRGSRRCAAHPTHPI